jgi:MFS-type transporter involved in bile tolerance (Atg22 family)
MLSDIDDLCVAVVLALCLNMSSDNDVCVASLLPAFLKRENNRRSPNNGIEGNVNSNMQFKLEASGSVTQTITTFVLFDSRSCDGLLKVVTPKIAKRSTSMWESSHSQAAFVHYATPFGNCKYF